MWVRVCEKANVIVTSHCGILGHAWGKVCNVTVGGIAYICFKWFQITADAQPGVSWVSNDQKFSKILIARSTIQPKLSKIKNNLPFFKEF